jgi:hypothetical protein
LSQQRLGAELGDIYNGRDLESLKFQFKDYAEWENKFSISDEYFSYREFWLKTFEGRIPKLSLPITNSNLDRSIYEGSSKIFKIDRSKIESITSVFKDEEFSIFSTLFSIYFIFLSELTGQDDIVIGVESSGRIQKELENVIGPFAKTLPIRCRIDSNITFKEFVVDVTKYLIKANARQVYDLSNIISELSSGRASQIENLFEATFIVKDLEQSSSKDGFLLHALNNTTVKYPLSLVVYEFENSFSFKFEYTTQYFTKDDIELLAVQFECLVDKISEGMSNKIFDMVSDNTEAASLAEDDISFNF